MTRARVHAKAGSGAQRAQLREAASALFRKRLYARTPAPVIELRQAWRRQAFLQAKRAIRAERRALAKAATLRGRKTARTA